jgi:hypothetical protein
VVETSAGGDVRALSVGAVCARRLRHLIERTGAPERERERAAIGEQGSEYLSCRNEVMRLGVDQPGVHSVSRGQEAVLGENQRARHHR